MMKSHLSCALCASVALALSPALLRAEPAASPAPSAGADGKAVGTPGEHAHEILFKYDKDGDKALNITELAAFFADIRQRVADFRAKKSAASATPSPSATADKDTHGSPQERAAQAIEKFDKNGDSKLDGPELAAMLSATRDRAAQARTKGTAHRAPAATPKAAN